VDIEQKVAVITGASQGIGAALVKAYRDRHYRVVATARSIRLSNDDEILTVPGDIAYRKTANPPLHLPSDLGSEGVVGAQRGGIFAAPECIQRLRIDAG
jgi:NAD(P)-dependent dehydrogenase (short-subunit alcohol dehydrogenase family)